MGHLIFRNSGKNHYYTDMKGYSRYLLRCFEGMTKPMEVDFANKVCCKDFIGINVRCGNDFVSKESGKRGFIKTRLSWFSHALHEVRQNYGRMPAIIVSDGGRSQLAGLLKEQDVYMLNSKTAAADILVLARSKVLLASGNSSFSAWASFLGEMDTFTSPETPFHHGQGLEYGRDGKKIIGFIG